MPNEFSLTSSQCADLTDPGLRAEIVARTESEVAVASILRTIDRFGRDPSIERFDLTPRRPGRGERTTNPVSWVVRARRAGDDVERLPDGDQGSSARRFGR